MKGFGKTTMIFLIFLLYFSIAQVVCYAYNWTLLTTSSTGMDTDTMGIAGVEGYADLDNVKINREKRTIQFWTKIVHIDNSSRVDLNLVDYMVPTRTILQSAGYDRSGKFTRFYESARNNSLILRGSFFDEILKPVMLKHGLDVYGRK